MRLPLCARSWSVENTQTAARPLFPVMPDQRAGCDKQLKSVLHNMSTLCSVVLADVLLLFTRGSKWVRVPHFDRPISHQPAVSKGRLVLGGRSLLNWRNINISPMFWVRFAQPTRCHAPAMLLPRGVHVTPAALRHDQSSDPQ